MTRLPSSSTSADGKVKGSIMGFDLFGSFRKTDALLVKPRVISTEDYDAIVEKIDRLEKERAVEKLKFDAVVNEMKEINEKP